MRCVQIRCEIQTNQDYQQCLAFQLNGTQLADFQLPNNE